MIGRERVPFRGGFMCDEMGLGKTIQMLTLVETLRGSTLVVAPKSVMHQWVRELKRFRLEDLVTVCTYHKIPGPGTFFHRIILDEGHEARNKSTKTHRALKALNYDKCWIVTGTPVFNSISDFINLASFIGIDRLSIQQDLEGVRDQIVIRRTKAQITQTTKCYVHCEELQMTGPEETLYTNVYLRCCQRYKALMHKLRKQEDDDEDSPTNKGTIEIMELYLRCRQAMIWPGLLQDDWDQPTAKFARLVELVGSHPEEKAIVFAHFRAEMDQVASLFSGTHKVFRLDGSVSEESRISQIRRFQTSKDPKCIFVIQIKAGGQGINLQAASRVYITSPAWNPATELQAICRAYRIGQTRDVHVTRLIYTCAGVPSVEESIQVLQNHKSVVTAEVLAEPVSGPIGRRVTAVELKKFFSGHITDNASTD